MLLLHIEFFLEETYNLSYTIILVVQFEISTIFDLNTYSNSDPLVITVLKFITVINHLISINLSAYVRTSDN